MQWVGKACVSALLLYIGLSMYGIWTFTGETELRHADAALVLGTRLEGEDPSYALRERINHAVWLYDNKFVETLVFTGGLTEGGSISEAEASKTYALSLGVPEQDIIIEDQSIVTRENMEFVKKLMASWEVDNFLLVSDPFHMKRALMMADVFDLQVEASPTPQSVYSTWAEQFPFVLRETLAYVGYQLTFHQAF